MTMIRYVIRGATLDDEKDLLALAHHLNTVNLPDDPVQVREILELSVKSFSGAIRDPRRREYVFVVEDRQEQRVIGTSKIIAQLGRRDAPYIYFDVITEEKYSATIDRHFVHTVLRLGFSYDGPTEIGGLIVLPEARRIPDKIGMMISYVRFMFIALHRGLFRNEVVAELLPPLQPDGTSLLWEALGRHFTHMSYHEADLLSKRNKEFIKSLFPTTDIYACLLPKEAQEVIGKVGRETLGVEKLLRRIGFQYCNRIDPFDGGPHFRAATDEILLVKRTRRLKVRAIQPVQQGTKALVAIELREAPFFRCVATPVLLHDQEEGLTVESHIADFLGLDVGTEVGVLPLD
uniref:Arginine N-succinyltransferase n=1 Tax=uncultured delta proteobacterium TaxID=34034 RepID=H5SLM2_9DELT|nr:arginine N-succinyltransferase [uncultured delta proteobacterium]